MRYSKGFWLPWAILILSRLSRGYDPTNPQNNKSPYTAADTLLSPGSAFPFNNEFPSARVLHSLDSTNNYLFVYGGYSSNGTTLGDINLFHIPSERWSGPIVRRECCNDMGQEIDTIGVERNTNNITFLKTGFEGDYPLPRADHASCTINDVLFIHGGETDRNSIGFMQDLYSFDPIKLRWNSLDEAESLSGGLPSRRAGHIMVADKENSRCLLFGGRQKARFPNSFDVVGLSDLWEFDANSYRWRRLDVPNANTLANKQMRPLGRHHSAAAIFRSRYFCIYGGSDPQTSLLFRDIWLFDLDSATWKQLYPETVGNVPLPTYEFSPPPLEHAHMLPVAFPESTFNEKEFEGFLLYSGVGTGGGCIAASCNSRQLAFGQVYFYSFSEQTWKRPFFDVNSDKSNKETTSHWLFARLQDENYGKRFKEYAYEKVALLPERKMLYEFGGLQANINAVRRNGQQADIIAVSDRGDAIAPSNRSPPQAVGGRTPATFSDTLTGEYLNAAVLAPTNGFWDLNTAFFNGSIFDDNFNGTIVFQRSLRAFTVASRDLIMVHSYDTK